MSGNKWTGVWRVTLQVALVALSACPVQAQVPETAVSALGPDAAVERPGLFRAGAWYLTPYLNVGTLGVDTNVFYTATERQTDFTASGGPGLEVVRPFGTRNRFRVDGGVNYLWFARTESQRRLNWYGAVSLELEGAKTSFAIEESYVGTYARPSFEVDTRVQQDTEEAKARLTRRLGDRWSLSFMGTRRDLRTDDERYLGTNLGETLTEKRYEVGGELRRALTIKTMLVGGAEHSWHRFPRLPERDGQSSLGYAGFRTDTSALVSGHALGGYRWFWLEADSTGDRGEWYANIDATLNISPKTKLGAIFYRDLDYTAFVATGPSPTLVREETTVFFDKVLASNLYLYVFARLIRYNTGDVLLAPPGEELVETFRDDRVREGGVELGYQFRSRVRMGVSAIYTERRSNIETFGIQGLLAGFTMTYNPPQPVIR